LEHDLIGLAGHAGVEPLEQPLELGRTLRPVRVLEPAAIRVGIPPQGGHQHLAAASGRELQLGTETAVLLDGALEHAVTAVELHHVVRLTAAWPQVQDAADHDPSATRSSGRDERTSRPPARTTTSSSRRMP